MTICLNCLTIFKQLKVQTLLFTQHQESLIRALHSKMGSIMVFTKYENKHSINLPTSGKAPEASPQNVAHDWLTKFADILAKGDVSLLNSVFHEECWWRDALTLSWDYHTLHGLSRIAKFLQSRVSEIGFGNFKLREKGPFTPSQTTITEDLEWIESFFTFETSIGHGQGVLRLTPDDEGHWKAYVVYTSMQELKGHEWATNGNRPHGGKNTLEGGIIKGNWFERRQRQKEFLDEEPTCLIIGAGKLA
jgi:hypothetical protein